MFFHVFFTVSKFSSVQCSCNVCNLNSANIAVSVITSNVTAYILLVYRTR